MTEQALKLRREYKRKWAHKNPDKVRAAQQRYWEKRAREQITAEQIQGDAKSGGTQE